MAHQSSDPIHVLHVDDDADFVGMAADLLEREDDRLTVETATDAGEGVERLAGGDVDCVVSDYDMPGRNGLEFLDAVREASPDLPFILFTGKGSEEVASEAISAGVDEYLQKEGSTEQYTILANRITNLVAGRRSRRALTERRRRLETLIHNLPGMVYRCRNEPGWPLEDIEGECEALTGYSPSTIVDGEVSFGADVIHPDDRDAVWEAVQAGLETDGSFEISYRIVTADGSEKWVWERGRAIHSADGEVAALEGFITDITARKEVEAELREKSNLLDQLFEQIPIHLNVKDRDGRYMYLSEYLVNEADNVPDADEQIGKTVLDVYPEEFAREAHEDDMAVMETGEPILDKEEFEPAEGEWNLSSKVPWRDEDDAVKGLITVTRQITERKQYERELERQNERLEEFASVVSHDLRNPLRLAEGRLALAGEDCDSEHLASIDDALDRMNRIIEDVLWLAREGRDIGATEPVDLAEQVETAWTMAADDREDATLLTDGLGTVDADDDRLCQLLENLFRNAVEHGPENVTVTVGELADGFYVADDGPGIPEGEQEDVFRPGYSTSEDGTGFGLSIAERIADAHGWELRVTDGARFEITGVDRDSSEPPDR